MVMCTLNLQGCNFKTRKNQKINRILIILNCSDNNLTGIEDLKIQFIIRGFFLIGYLQQVE
jgi:hypothetical protein